MSLVVFVGGVAERVNEKIDVQNAADAAAYSNSLWMARGMNAVTTSNHLMGELTALCIIHESFGALEIETGRGSRQERVVPVEISKKLSKEIRDLKNVHYPDQHKPPATLPGFAILYGQLDKQFVAKVVDQIASDNEGDGRHSSGAAIFDSNIRLKESALFALRLKSSLRKVNDLLHPASIPSPVLPFIVAADAATIVAPYFCRQVVV